MGTLPETNLSHARVVGKMSFPFHWWDIMYGLPFFGRYINHLPPVNYRPVDLLKVPGFDLICRDPETNSWVPSHLKTNAQGSAEKFPGQTITFIKGILAYPPPKLPPQE